jgi:hypothetical protein
VRRSGSEQEIVMATALESFVETESRLRPALTSYDTGFEHSLDHHVEVRRKVEEADRELAPLKLRGILTD